MFSDHVDDQLATCKSLASLNRFESPNLIVQTLEKLIISLISTSPGAGQQEL
jgi:hypothetical protein